MANGSGTGKSYLSVVKALHRMLWDEYRNGGWLPSSRELAKMLAVSHATCCKALKRMVRENFICNYPQKGHYAVPEYLCCHKVGLIFNDGEDSPFIREAPLVPEAINLINQNGFDVQVIQQARLEKLYENAVLHGVEGILWFWPPSRALPLIGQICAEGDTPLVAVLPDQFWLTGGGGAADCYVCYDRAEIAKVRVRQIVARGHKKILYAGDYERAEALGVVKLFRAAGAAFTPAHCIADTLAGRGEIQRMVVEGGVSAVVSEGGPLHVHCLLEELSALPAPVRPEVFITPFAVLPQILRRFPGINLIELDEPEAGNHGRAAAQMLIDRILRRRPVGKVALGPQGAGGKSKR